MKSLHLLLLLFLLSLTACITYQKHSTNDDGKLQFQILQVNDVYEIAPLEGGMVGGMARVAQLRKEMLQENTNTLAILSGDFLNPSVIGTLKLEGERISGKQMVEVMNAAGIDLVTFGNHEFDVKENELQKRLNESEFKWLGSNVLHQMEDEQKAFQSNGEDVPEYIIQTFQDADGTSIKVGFIGATINANQQDYVFYEDVFLESKRLYDLVAPQVDLVLAITHLDITEDIKLAKIIPKVPLLMGGHDHSHMNVPVGKSRVVKADANAKTAYWHTVTFNKGRFSIDSKLIKLDESMPLEPKTNIVVQKWMDTAKDLFRENGLNPDRVVAKLPKPIDARESVIRHQPTTISTLIAKAYLAASPEADAALVNTGSIRVDDVLEGTLSEYDIARILPFGGAIDVVEMKGELLEKVVSIGRTENVSKGGFLALEHITFQEETQQVFLKGKKVEPTKNYKIAMPRFLLTGLESNLDFLTPENEGIVSIKKPSEKEVSRDARLALIDYLQKNKIVYLE